MRNKLSHFSLGLIMLIMFVIPYRTWAQADIVKIGFYSNRPHIYLNDEKKITGAAVEYWHKYLVPKMKSKVQWYGPLTKNKIKVHLRIGAIHAALIFPENEIDHNIVNVPKKPFYSSRSTLMVLNGSTLKNITAAKDLNGLKIGFSKDETPASFITDNQIPLELITGKNWIQKTVSALVGKSIDAVHFPDEYIALYYQNGLNLKDQVKIVPLPGQAVNYYTVFSKAKGTRLLEFYDNMQQVLTDNDINYIQTLKKHLE